MGPSKFQFTNPLLLNLSMEINRRFAPNDTAVLETKFHVRIDRHPDKREAIVELTVEIGGKEPSMPYFISLTEGAKFRWEEEADSKIDILLNQNAPALLLGYMRPIVAALTVASPYEAYNIPFIDFTKVDSINDDNDR